MTTNDPTTPAPQVLDRRDYQRAAAVILHGIARDVDGFNAVVADAVQDQRTALLILALVELAVTAPKTALLDTPEGVAGLRSVALGMAD
ncbi:hypothetical protein GCM10010528_00640 [Gordonia defluvii]|uniref:Uncharacterized protein n=1 Tax=Gordonia defluvii TaxID=283718 RepID=A0ABN3Y8A3_9ACTN